MEWQVRYHRRSVECIGRYPTQEIALKAACLLIDQGCDVLGIGLAPGTSDLDPEQVAEFYRSWAHERWIVAATEPGEYSVGPGPSNFRV